MRTSNYRFKCVFSLKNNGTGRKNFAFFTASILLTMLCVGLMATPVLAEKKMPEPPLRAQYGLLGQNGWDHPPSIFIRTLYEPTLDDYENGVKVSSKTFGGIELILDAIYEFWLEGSSYDSETGEGSADSIFKDFGFGPITMGPSGTGDITIIFRAWGFWADTRVDEVNGHITSSLINLASYTQEYRMNTERWGGDETFKNAIAHELGHAIGLKHFGKPQTLMQSNLWDGPPPTWSNGDGVNYWHTAYMPLGSATHNQLERMYGDY